MAMGDYEDHLAIMGAVDQVLEALPGIAPRKFWKNRRRVHFYDLRGKVDAMPRLGIACMFPLSRFAVSKQDARSPFGPVILCPSLPAAWFDRTVIRSQTGLHHEVAHVLLGHELDPGYAMNGPAYFNHPYEQAAFLHQALAAAARDGGWGAPDADAFRAAVMAGFPRQFVAALTEASACDLDRRIGAVWEARHAAHAPATRI